MSPRDTRNVRNGRPAVAPRRSLPSMGPHRRPSIFEVDLGEAAPRLGPPRDRWALVVAAFVVCAFATVFTAYVLQPAMTTLADASVATWTGDGP